MDLDDLATRDAVRADPALFVRGEAPVLIDEFQHVPELLDAIKAELNRDGAAGRSSNEKTAESPRWRSRPPRVSPPASCAGSSSCAVSWGASSSAESSFTRVPTRTPTTAD